MLYLSATPYFRAANDMASPVTSFSGLAPPKRGRPYCLAGNEGRGRAVSRLTAADAWHVVRSDNGSSPVPPNGQLCGLFAADIAGFNGSRRDEDIQLYVHKSLYEMLQAAFERADVPWSGCAHEDRGDGVLVVIPPTIPLSGLVDPIPDRLRGLIRRHNRVSCEAAQIQLRIAAHIGPVHNDGHGFVGRDVNLLHRLLDARALKRMLSESGAEVAFIASSYVYDTVIRRRPSLVDPALFQPLAVRVKETRTRAWACVLGA